ncbi:ErfK/YbiS/YcfS/YnhG family protein [Chthoniobacter flavus Ellin428]|uniref:ErfK/YbiS/YcfS/YnhG family protein n=1 Tax=Chthoniobacter flavus Ellin428 TaxID=497964 RepID=B4D0S1_9BACT|nr:L,D-transpeptidase [Chthoniobacter flavus]EDY19933.1 ErfK/YbiS/YcfS/YnhG family protein [Chthoniobacter flavus Ellin428]TCO91796.1 L,D-transpeptidase-like protein [Chthoniobacter flavus]
MKPRRCFSILTTLAILCLSRVVAMATTPEIIISVPDQQMVIMENGVLAAHYPISTSKFGLGDQPSSYATPLGLLEVAAKVGDGAPMGAVFKGQHMTGEIIPPNAPGRDPIVTRILHLRGMEAGNARAYDRGIYIHGTPEEARIGRPASYGCIRMRSKDVVRVFDAVPVGTKITIVNSPLRHALAEYAVQHVSQSRHVAAN